MSYNINLEIYDGPIDLLCNLVNKSKIDIKEVFINKIVKQYTDYIKELEKHDMEVCAEFLTMATRLLYIKSNSILRINTVIEDDEEDISNELAKQLELYMLYKKAANHFKEKCNLSDTSYFRVKEEIIDEDEEIILEGFDKKYIYSGINMILNEKKLEEEENDILKETDEKLKTIYKAKFVPIEEKIDVIEKKLKDTDTLLFSEITKSDSKSGVVASFLALLEMNKYKDIDTIQENPFDDIQIKKRI